MVPAMAKRIGMLKKKLARTIEKTNKAGKSKPRNSFSYAMSKRAVQKKTARSN
tara:strand:- start:5873 stop:6031 length:159 start_codon:yes stop_codon:yes gene_type:complete